MSIWRRVMYATFGAIPVSVGLFALYLNYGAWTMYSRGYEYLAEVLSLRNEWTPSAFFMFLIGLYVLTSAVRGERLLSRKWLLSAIATVILTWVLICGMAIYRGFIAPEPLRPYLQAFYYGTD